MGYNDIRMENGRTIDRIGYAFIKGLNIEAYAVDFTIKASSDCRKARDYYREVMALYGYNIKKYEMHHTLDGYIVPILRTLHRTVDHIGGVYIFGLER